MTLTRNDAIEQKMNQIARTGLLRVIESHTEAVTAVVTAMGSHLHDCDIAALDDYLAAMQRLTKTLAAGGVE